MVDRASVPLEVGSSVPSSRFDPTPRNNRRSSSRPSRKSTREIELNIANIPQTSYSLPPTPLTSSFEESLSSAKRRKTQRSLNGEQTPQPEEATETSNQKSRLETTQDSSSVPKRSSRNTKSEKPTEDAAQTSGSQDSQIPSPSTSNSKHKSQTGHSQSTLHAYLLKSPQDRRKSLPTQTELTYPKKNKSNAEPSTMNPATTESNRKARKSLPPKLNLGKSLEKDETQSQVSAPRSSTPQSTRNDRNPRAAAQASAKVSKSTTINSKTQATPAGQSISKASKNQVNGAATNGTTPVVPAHVSTPVNSTARSRRRDRRSTRSAMRNPTNQTHETQSEAASVSGHTDENSPSTPSQHVATRSSRARRANKALALNSRTSLDTPATLDTLDSLSFNREIADSVEGTPVHVYSDNFPFDYDTEMYGSSFGLGGQADGPASPTSFSTATSTAMRTSGRTRKPTIRALESMESERRFRRVRGPSSKPESTSGDVPGGKGPSVQQNEPGVLESTQPGVVPHTVQVFDLAIISKRLFNLVAEAVSSGLPADTDAEARLETLRNDFLAKKGTGTAREPVKNVVESAGESRLTSSMPILDKTTQASKPWTDQDGWMHTGKINEFGEEYIVVSPDFQLYRPNNTYGDDELPQPPARFRSQEQVEKDRIFGYPPRIGERNLPRDIRYPFMFEDVNEEKAKIKAREEARQRGIIVDRTMSFAQIQAMISEHDNAGKTVEQNSAEPKNSKETEKPARSSRKRRRTEPVNSTIAADPSTIEPPQTNPRPRRRRQIPAATSVATTPAPPEKAPASPQKKIVKLKLFLSNPEKKSAMAALASRNGPSSQSKKRPLSTTEFAGAESEEGQAVDIKTPKRIKLSLSKAKPPTTPADQTHEESNQALSSGVATPPTEGGRPRRRAAAALMAEFQSHAEERARRAHARKKEDPKS